MSVICLSVENTVGIGGSKSEALATWKILAGAWKSQQGATPLNCEYGRLPSEARLAVAFQPFSNVVAVNRK